MMLSNILGVDNNSGALVAKQRIDEAPFWRESSHKKGLLAIWQGIFAKLAEVKERKTFATNQPYAIALPR